MEDKGIGFIAILLVWGGALYLFGNSLIGGGNHLISGNGFLASTLANFQEALNTKKDVMGVFDSGGDYRKSMVNFDSSMNVRGITVSPDNPGLVFASSDDGLLVSNDNGLIWHIFSDVEHKINSGANVYKTLFDSKGNGYISIFKNGQGTLYGSGDNFLTVEKLFSIDGEAVYDFDFSGDNIYLGLSDGRVFSYSISRKNSRVVSALPSAITILKAGRQNKSLIYASVKSGGFYTSNNGGQSFQRMKYLDNYNGANKINDFTVSPSNDYLIYAATDYGLIKSTDGGKSWGVFESLPSEQKQISSVYYSASSSEIYASSKGKLYMNKTGEQNWSIFDTGLSRNISAVGLNGGNIIIGTKN